MITRVALISVGDARDPGVWSGIPWQIRSTLTAMGVDVTDVSPLRVPFARGRHLAFTAAQRIGRHYRYDLDRGSIRAMGRAANRRLSESRVDAVISTSMLPLAALRTTLPVGVWQDATIANLVETYAEYRRLSAARRRRLFAMEREILSRVTVAGYASSWAARSAIEVLGAPESRVVELPFGAGLLPRGGFDPAPALAARATDVCRLAWIGADWQRKRGDFAIAVAQALVERGRQVHLTMVGQAPPHGT
ncbi:hypothetical protein, partial [Paraconexibacter sp.]|uniref:hypothetical protein n=1 Tax=Paraconexibacter sp. TaxID=2949640 RepID=UPI00356AA526